MRIYLRQISVIGDIPQTGPIIFVPNHNNLYIDALSIVCYSPRHIAFLAAEQTLKKSPVMNFFKHIYNAIPVKRSIGVKGDGKIRLGYLTKTKSKLYYFYLKIS